MSVALKKLGATFPVSAIGLIGKDADGRKLIEICDEFGIEHTALKQRSDVSTSFTLVMNSKNSGKRTFFNFSGSHAVQTPDDFDFQDSTARIARSVPRLG